jgi:preprotein translocase subunit SecD
MILKISAAILFLCLTAICQAGEAFEVRVMSLAQQEGYTEFPSKATGSTAAVFCAKDVVMDSRNVTEASVSPDQLSDGSYGVQIKIDAQAKRNLLELSKQATEEKQIQLAFIVNGTVITAPVLHGPILTETFLIQGAFTKEQAESLSKALQPKAAGQ